MKEIPFTICAEGIAACPAPMRQLFWRWCAESGFPYVVLTTEMIRKIMGDPDFAAALREETRLGGVQFVDSHAPFGAAEDLCLIGSGRAEMLARNRMAIEIAASFGVDTMTIHAGHDTRACYTGFTVERLCEATREALLELLPTAERCGITICLENIWFRNCHAARVLETVRSIDSANIGVCFDSGHANLMENGRLHDTGDAAEAWGGKENVAWCDQSLEMLLPYVVNTHLHDNDGSRDQHRLPGQGNVPWGWIIPLLKRAPQLRSIQSETPPLFNMVTFREIAAAFGKWLDIRNGMVRLED